MAYEPAICLNCGDVIEARGQWVHFNTLSVYRPEVRPRAEPLRDQGNHIVKPKGTVKV